MTLPPVPPFPPPGPPTQKTERRIARGVMVFIAAALIGVGGYVVGTRGDGTDPKPAKASASTANDIDLPALDDVETTPEYTEYSPDDFLMELKTTSKECFGSAGCLVDVEPELTFVGDSADIDPGATYRITYEITGDEDGPIIDTLTLTDQDDITYNETTVSTVSSNTEIDVEITDVEVS